MKMALSKSNGSSRRAEGKAFRRAGSKLMKKLPEARAVVQKAADQAQNENAQVEGKRTPQSAQDVARDQGKKARQRAGDHVQNEIVKSK